VKLEVLFKHFRRLGGKYRMARAIFDLSRDNTKQNNGRRKFYRQVLLQGKNTKFKAGYIGLRDRVGREEVDLRLEQKTITNGNNQLLVLP